LFPEITFQNKSYCRCWQQPVDKMMVTVTIRKCNQENPNLKTVRSTTSRGSCEISAFVDWNADLDVSKQQIESRINQIRTDLPGYSNHSGKDESIYSSVTGYALESTNRSPIELKK
jgi:multidrug efflux pump subunit AcrB